jgi:nitrogen regulatory protein PII
VQAIQLSVVRDKSRLPFEVTKDEGKQQLKQQRQHEENGKKRIEVLVNPEKAVAVLSALRKMNLEATLYDSKGYGKERQLVSGGGRGTTSIELPSTRHTVMTIIEANRLKEVISAIKATTTKSRPGGIIVVSSIEDLEYM